MYLQALASLKQKVRKYNRDFEADIAHCRENPALYEEEEEEEEEEEKEMEEEESEWVGMAYWIPLCVTGGTGEEEEEEEEEKVTEGKTTTTQEQDEVCIALEITVLYFDL